MIVRAWHYTAGTLRDGRPIPPVGEWIHEVKAVLCETGLHASRSPLDALRYAPGVMVHRVELVCPIDGGNKLVSCARRILWSIDGRAALSAFARRCALDVLPAGAPAVLREYLLRGRESVRAAARGAAWSAASDTAWSPAWSAAWSAASDTAWSAAWSAARSAAWGAARSAASDPAWETAADTAWSAARQKQDARLGRMLREARNGRSRWEWTR